MPREISCPCHRPGLKFPWRYHEPVMRSGFKTSTYMFHDPRLFIQNIWFTSLLYFNCLKSCKNLEETLSLAQLIGCSVKARRLSTRLQRGKVVELLIRWDHLQQWFCMDPLVNRIVVEFKYSTWSHLIRKMFFQGWSIAPSLVSTRIRDKHQVNDSYKYICVYIFGMVVLFRLHLLIRKLILQSPCV